MATEFNDIDNESENEESRHYMWHDSLSCGHESIDTDHRYLFDIAERLRIAGIHGQADAEIGQILAELMDYVDRHFAREEALMQAVDYPCMADHRFEHSLLIRRVKSLYRRFIEGKPLQPREVAQFVNRWLRYHIMHSDLDMARYAARWTLLHSIKDE
ncbi:MAG TPA: bacteriohemerythrin [Burkholderiaceae bacterium]|nr:bacteriohemerythrin [Burkholderiaceae bacterium]